MPEDLDSILGTTPQRSAASPSAAYQQATNTSDVASTLSRQVSALMRRYKDAYIVARATNGFGGLIKGIGITIAVVLLLIGFLLINSVRGGDAMFAVGVATIVFGVIVGVWFYIVGVLVSAQGQILKASLDSAVNNSPFLTNEHRAKITALPEA